MSTAQRIIRNAASQCMRQYNQSVKDFEAETNNHNRLKRVHAENRLRTAASIKAQKDIIPHINPLMISSRMRNEIQAHVTSNIYGLKQFGNLLEWLDADNPAYERTQEQIRAIRSRRGALQTAYLKVITCMHPTTYRGIDEIRGMLTQSTGVGKGENRIDATPVRNCLRVLHMAKLIIADDLAAPCYIDKPKRYKFVPRDWQLYHDIIVTAKQTLADRSPDVLQNGQQ